MTAAPAANIAQNHTLSEEEGCRPTPLHEARDNRAYLLGIAKALLKRSEAGENVSQDDLAWSLQMLANNRAGR